MSDSIRPGAINPLRPPSLVDGGRRPGVVADQGDTDFHSVLLNSLDEVSRLQNEATEATQKLYRGGDVNPEEVFSAVRKAEVAFNLLMEIRNKLVEAYKEIEQLRV